MRVALAVVTALAGSALGFATAPPASAEACTPPAVAGFTISSLTAHGITCHEAQGHAAHTIRHGAPAGWTCSHRISGRFVSFSCHAADGSGRSYHFGYHVH